MLSWLSWLLMESKKAQGLDRSLHRHVAKGADVDDVVAEPRSAVRTIAQTFSSARNFPARKCHCAGITHVTPIEHVPNTAQQRSKNAAGANIEAPALDRGLAILEALDGRPEGMSLSEISRVIGSPKNSTSRLVQTLMVRGYVERDEATMIIRLTGKLLRLGHPRVGRVSLVECALEPMRMLRDAVGETVQLGIPISDEGVIIEQVESTQAVRICVEIGLRFPLHNNAPGKVLLTFQHPKSREKTIQRLKLARFTDRTITSKDALRQECERVAKLGYGTDWGEADEGIHCVAAPVFDRPNHLLAVVWASAVAGRMPKARFPKVAVEVMKSAREIERRLRA
jgi:DNA-binding IclR family transcriptional regulator